MYQWCSLIYLIFRGCRRSGRSKRFQSKHQRNVRYIIQRNHPMSVNLIRYLNQVAICSLDGLRNHLPEIRQSDPELRFQGDEKILAHLGKNDGYYLNEKIFLNPELNDSEYQQTLVNELEHYRHRHFDQSREELISEILAYHAEDLWHNPDLR